MTIQQDATVLTTKESRLIHSLALLGDMTRYKMFRLLSNRSGLCVSQIADELSISPSAVSQHFKQFEMLRIVHKVRTGQKICYELNRDDALVNELLQLTAKEK